MAIDRRGTRSRHGRVRLLSYYSRSLNGIFEYSFVRVTICREWRQDARAREADVSDCYTKWMGDHTACRVGSDECNDGWMDGWVDGWVDGWMDGWVDGWMGDHTACRVGSDECIDGCIDGWVDGWMGGWMGG